MKNLRILPVTVIAMVLVFGLKIGSVWTDTQGFFVELKVAEVSAAGDEDKENAENEDAASHVDENEEDKSSYSAISEMSESEIEVLQRLVERRDALDQRSKEQDMRGNLLRATESRIDQKIAKLKGIEATIQDLLKQYDEQELKRLKSLVSIYEKMKPKDAARIFNTLDMEILLEVTGLMKESKLAVILGKMEGTRAQKLTVELATRKPLPDLEKKKKS
ncbi:MAG: hypothetical protein JKX94_10130 [Sneathiella sp.]|nr:hypothetical protein [Sneathiella sp.]